MEKSILYNLSDIVVNKLTANLIQIISCICKSCLVIYLNSVYILHDKYVCCRIFAEQLRCGDKRHLSVVPGKFLHIGSLCHEVHLFLRHCPHFIEYHVQIHNALYGYWRHKLYRTVQQRNIL